MKPWELATSDKRLDENKYQASWIGYMPRDFYFAIKFDNDVAVIYIVPKQYFNLKKNMYELSMPIVHLLPEFLEETMPGIYEAKNVDRYTVNNEMVKRGFDYNVQFQVFIGSILTDWEAYS